MKKEISEDGERIAGNLPCPHCESSDAVSVYEKEDDKGKTIYDGFCFSCHEYIDPELTDDFYENDFESYQKKGMVLTQDIEKEFERIEELEFRGWKERRLPKDISEFFGVKTEFDEEGDVKHRYYPITQNRELVGYKKRNDWVKKAKNRGEKVKAPSFVAIGKNKITCEMFGQSKFRKGGKFLIITSGEEDVLAWYRAMNEDSKYECPVVCSTVGESNTVSQIKHNYDWVTSFEKVLISMDNDKVGEESATEIARVLKPSQGHIIKLKRKDACEHSKRNEWYELKQAFWNGVNHGRYSPAGIVGSSETWDAMVNRAKVTKVSLPAFAEDLQEMFRGGLALGEITTLAAACVDAETEYLTRQGWKKITDFDPNDSIAVVDESRNLYFEEPLNYISQKCDEMYHFKTKYGVDQMVSKNHRMPHISVGGNFSVKTAQEIYENHNKNVNGFRGNFIQVFNTQGGEGVNYSEGELRLQIAVMADGRIVKEGKNNYTQMRFRKKRKYDRLIEMCNYYNLKYSDRGWYNSEQTYQVIVWPKTDCKHFDDTWFEASNDQLAIIADEVMFWDATTIHNNAYFSNHKVDCDFIQYVFSSQGYRSRIARGTNVWETHIKGKIGESKRGVGMGMSRGASGKPVINTVKPTDGMQYCFETSTGFWLARRNGNVFMTGNSSIGKTSIVNEFLYHWVMNTEYKVGVVSLESDVGELAENLMSLHINKKLANMDDDEKINYYENDPEASEKHKELMTLPDGTDRFNILDHQGDVVDGELREKIEYLVKAMGCKIIILDPLTLALSGEGNEGMDLFMSWLLRFVKREQVSFVNVVHVRKNSSGTRANSRGADISEEEIKGSGSIFQVSMNNILLMRDKLADDPVVRNTTKVLVSKNRRLGNTGSAGFWYYNGDTARLTKGVDPEDINDHYLDDEELFGEAGAYNNEDPEEYGEKIEASRFNRPEKTEE